MSVAYKMSSVHTTLKLMTRAFCCSPALETKQWRMSNGLPVNRNAEGILTDGPDYTYLDGRPTPLLHKQKQRLIKQQGIATKIVTLNSELQFAKERHVNMLKAKEEEIQKYIDDRLKPKGDNLRKK